VEALSKFPEFESQVEEHRIWLMHGRAQLLETRGQYEEAKNAFAEYVDATQKALAEDPENSLKQDHVATARIGLGDAWSMLKRPDEALKQYQLVVPVRRERLRLDPQSALAKQQLALSVSRIANIHEINGDYQAIFEPIAEVVQIHRDLVAQEPGNVEFQRNLWIELLIQARAFAMNWRSDFEHNVKTNDYRGIEEAEKIYRLAEEITSRLADRNPPAVADIEGLGQACLGLGECAMERWQQEMAASPNDQPAESPLFKEAESWFHKGLEAYSRIAAGGPLTPKQESIRDSIERMLVLLRDSAEKFQALNSSDEIQ